MSERRHDAVDAFLADLGAADVPQDLAPAVMRRVVHERQPRASRFSPWLAAAAVLVTVVLVLALTAAAWIVAGPGPSPMPLLSPAPVPSAPAVRPTTSPSAPQGTPSPGPTGAAAPFDSWSITLAPNPRLTLVSLELMGLDYSGTMTGVAQPTAARPAETGGPHDLAIGPGSDGRSITVAWVGGVCDEVAHLELAADGRTLALRLAPRPACDAMGVEFAVELRFKDPVDPATFHGTWSEDLVTPADVNPQAVAFADPQHGFVGGQTWAYSTPAILETVDGGATWRVEGLGGLGDVTAIGVMPDGRAWAGVACPADLVQCRSGLYRYDEGSWGRVGDAWPVRLSFAGDVGAGLFAVPGGPVDGNGDPIAELRLMDGDEVWSKVAKPCPTGSRTEGVSRTDAATIVVLCGSRGSDIVAPQALYHSTDGGASWSRLADASSYGAAKAIDLAADGTGWMVRDASPMLRTSNGGVSWVPLEASADDARPVVDADYLGEGLGFALVRDLGREQVLLRRAGDGRPWTELAAYPVICCGG